MLISFIVKKKYLHIEKLDVVLGLSWVLVILYDVIVLSSPVLNSVYLYLLLFLLIKLLFNNSKYNLELLFKLLPLCLLALFVCNVIYFVIWGGNYKSFNQISGFYNNINHFSLALCLSSVGCLYLYIYSHKKYLYLFTAMLLMIGFLQSRTYLLFVALLVVYAIFRKLFSYKKGLVFISAVIAINLFGYALNKKITSRENVYTNRVIETAVLLKKEKRFTLWSNSLQQVAQKPMGYGLGNYEHSMLFFDKNKKTLKAYKSPHNEFVRVIYELGVVGVILIILFLSMLIYYLKKYRAKIDGQSKLLVDGLILLSMLEFSFQFPFERAIYFVFLVVVLSKLRTGLVKKISAMPVRIFIFMIASYLWIGLYGNTKIYPEGFKSSFCKYWPTESKACLNQVKTVSPQKGEIMVKQSMRYNLYNFHYWQALGFMEFQNGKQKEGCESLLMFNKITNGLDEATNNFFNQNCILSNLKNIEISEAISYKEL